MSNARYGLYKFNTNKTKRTSKRARAITANKQEIKSPNFISKNVGWVKILFFRRILQYDVRYDIQKKFT